MKEQKTTENLKEKLSRLQLSNKRFQSERSKGQKKSLLSDVAEVESDSSKSSTPIPEEDLEKISQKETGSSEDLACRDVFAASSTIGEAHSQREAIALTPTKTIIRRKSERKSRRKSTKMEEVVPFRRETRASFARLSQQKRPLDSGSSSYSSTSSRNKRPRLLEVEGLPSLVSQGLSFISYLIDSYIVIVFYLLSICILFLISFL